MFQLEQAINDVTKKIVGCSSHLSQHEIKDHLFSTVEDLMQQGSTEEEAYNMAVKRIGDLSELKRELQNISNGEHFMNYRNPAFQQIFTALFFAGAILASSWFGFSSTATYLLIAVWFVPFLLISRQSSISAKEELHCLTKKLNLK